MSPGLLSILLCPFAPFLQKSSLDLKGKAPQSRRVFIPSPSHPHLLLLFFSLLSHVPSISLPSVLKMDTVRAAVRRVSKRLLNKKSK